ncbi:MAG: type II toxin-antitoxin system VapC family toxin [Thermodesulfobacteriota bacterium]|nr:type II toxin-antitoxin system VapC family toxin [Thermodesulfobacteriota bacterium]
MKKIILDTNAYTRLLAGDEDVLDIISMADTLYMSIFVLGELYAGFAGGSKEQENRETLNRFLLKPTVKILNATLETAEVFGMVKSKLKTAGTPLPINDIWIAAHAIETGSTIITFDKHFKEVSGLRLWNHVRL